MGNTIKNENITKNDRKSWWINIIEEHGFYNIQTVNVDKKPTSGFEFFFTADKDNKKVFIKCGNGDVYAKKEYEIYKILHAIEPKHFPDALMYKHFENNKMFLAMEYIDGITLDKVDYSEMQTEYLNNMFDSLYNIGQVLYKKKYIHRDFHWGNLIVERSGNIKCIDFQHLLGEGFLEAEENIKQPKKLRGTNKKLRPAPYVWDDMYSIWKMMQKFPKNKIENYDIKISDIKSKLGDLRYYFMDNKFSLKTYLNMKILIVYKIINIVGKPFRKNKFKYLDTKQYLAQNYN